MRIHANILHQEMGQTATEYAVALGVITVGVVLALTSLAQVTVSTIERVAGYFS